MKTNNVLKIGFFAVAFALLSAGVKAQTHTNYVEFSAAGTAESVDTVTVGSRMPYYVAPQTAISGLDFEYKWLFSPALTILNYAGNANAQAGNSAAPGYYKENEISVVMPASPGAITVNTNVQWVSGTTVSCPPGSDDAYSIQVVPAPTMIWKNTPEITQCSPVAADVPVDIQLTGYGQWLVNYNIVKSDLDGNNPGTANNKTDRPIGAAKDNVGLTATDFQLMIDQGDFSGPGLYTITVTQLTDRISRKSLDLVNGTLPTSTFVIKVYPTPTTNKLQHVKNMP
jgi:hypothetical protein